MTELKPMTGLARYKMATELEAEGLSAAEIAERCGYSNPSNWYAAKAYYKKAEERFNARAALPEETDVPMPSTASHVAGKRIPIPQRVKAPEISPEQIYALKPKAKKEDGSEPVGAATKALNAAMDKPMERIDALIHSLKPQAPTAYIDPAPIVTMPKRAAPARSFRATALDGEMMRYALDDDCLLVTSREDPQRSMRFPLVTLEDCLGEIADAVRLLRREWVEGGTT
jgi:hypothetical protein